MNIIVVLPGLLAAFYAFTRSPQMAFVRVYIPVLFILPSFYTWKGPGLPPTSFHHWCILPIFAVFVARQLGQYRFSLQDLLVAAYTALVFVSELTNANYKEAQNLLFSVLTQIVMPYVLAKALIEPGGLRSEFSRRLVLSVFIVACVSLYEFKMGRTPFAMVLDPFFPGQNNWVTTFRYGFARTAGSYGHAILAGVIMAAAWRLQRWRQWTGEDSSPRVAWILALGVLGGSIMTLCRGPWIGAFLGTLPVIAARSPKPKVVAIVIVAGLVGFGTPAAIAFNAYVSVGRENAKTTSQETAAYRKELLDKYGEIAAERPCLGWGRLGWPKVPGMPSIDNHFLLLTIMHGKIAARIFMGIMIIQCVRLGLLARKVPRSRPEYLLSVSLMGTLLMIFVSIATVYLGGQVEQLLFLVVGWSEGLIQRGRRGDFSGSVGAGAAPASVERSSPAFAFERVLA